MKLATLRTAFGNSAIRIEGDNVGVELDYEDVGALLRSEDWRKAAQLSGEPIVFDQHDLEAVVPTPGKIICVGLNYAKHIREMGREFPEHPTLFIKFADALTAPSMTSISPSTLPRNWTTKVSLRWSSASARTA